MSFYFRCTLNLQSAVSVLLLKNHSTVLLLGQQLNQCINRLHAAIMWCQNDGKKTFLLGKFTWKASHVTWLVKSWCCKWIYMRVKVNVWWFPLCCLKVHEHNKVERTPSRLENSNVPTSHECTSHTWLLSLDTAWYSWRTNFPVKSFHGKVFQCLKTLMVKNLKISARFQRRLPNYLSQPFSRSLAVIHPFINSLFSVTVVCSCVLPLSFPVTPRWLLLCTPPSLLHCLQLSLNYCPRVCVCVSVCVAWGVQPVPPSASWDGQVVRHRPLRLWWPFPAVRGQTAVGTVWRKGLKVVRVPLGWHFVYSRQLVGFWLSWELLQDHTKSLRGRTHTKTS